MTVKARFENGQIKRYIEMPKYWAHYAGNFDVQPDSVHEEYGFYLVVFPEWDATTKIRGEIYWDDTNQVFTYPITDKSAEQIEAEYQAYIDGLDSEFDNEAAKRILKKIMEPILADEENLTAEDIVDSSMLYPYYRAGELYTVGFRFRYEGELFETVQEHTTQHDWIPTELPALYKHFTPAGIIAEWVQPTGAQDAYNTGDKVTHNGSTWESTVDDNVWEPGVYGWVTV